MEELELFTTFNGHFVYDDDIYALGMGEHLRKKDEHDEEQDYLMRSDPRDDYYPTCFECGLSYADTVDYQERED